jgi:8-oxo-dGTP pyrophosphatase MutT (NUDIX family)
MSKPRFTFVSAVHLFLLRGEQVLLLRRFNTGYEDGNYSVPAGHLDGGEQVIQAAIREAREEIGIEIAPEDLAVAGIMHRKAEDERIDVFVAATRWTGEPRNCEPDKCDELRWVDNDTLPENVIPYVRRALENYQAGRWFDSFGWPDE